MVVTEKYLIESCILEHVSNIAKRRACATELNLRVSYATDTGLMREQNEDSFCIGGRLTHKFGESEHGGYSVPSGGTHIFGLFDGMGGEAFGEAASEISAQTMNSYNGRFSDCSAERLNTLMNEYAERANCGILDMLTKRGADGGGSTFTAIVVKDGTAYPYYIGDSRIYLYKDGVLRQLSRDQTLAQRLVDAGYMTEKEAEHSYESHVLTNFLGADGKRQGLEVQVCEPVPLEVGVMLLMCSDGLSDMCSRREIAAVMRRSSPDTASKLVEAALKNGGFDNVTCVTVGCFENLKKRTDTADPKLRLPIR